MKLKEECAQLRLDLNKARHRLHQLEGTRILGWDWRPGSKSWKSMEISMGETSEKPYEQLVRCYASQPLAWALGFLFAKVVRLGGGSSQNDGNMVSNPSLAAGGKRQNDRANFAINLAERGSCRHTVSLSRKGSPNAEMVFFQHFLH